MEATTKKLISKIQEYRNDWNKYARDILNVNLDQSQQEILHAINHNRRVSVRSGHARGKDYLTAVACLCFLTLHKPSKVINTAPTDRQVNAIMMAEISKIYKNAKVPLGGILYKTMIRMSEDDTWYLMGFKPDEHRAEAWTGFHSPNIMVAVTEATGLDDSIFESIEGILQGNSRLVLIFNPTKMNGEAYQSTISNQYASFRLNCIDAPNVVNERRYRDGEITKKEFKKLWIPGQVDYEWIDEKVKKPGWVDKIIDQPLETYDFQWEGEYYRPSNLFRVKVLGEFPDEDEDTLVPLQLLEQGFQRYEALTKEDLEKNQEEYLNIGVDIAGMGRDQNVFVERAGMVVENLYTFAQKHKSETIHMQVAGKIANLYSRYKWRYPNFFIDTIGEGAGVHSRLIEQGYDCVHSVKGSFKVDYADKTGNMKFSNLRSYMYWKIREFLQDGGAVPRNNYLMEELSKIRYEFDSYGRIQIEKKDNIKKRIGRSPDWSDAFSQTFCPIASETVESDGSALSNLTF